MTDLLVYTARLGARIPETFEPMNGYEVGRSDLLDITRGGSDRRIAAGEVGGHHGIGAAFAPSGPLFSRFIAERRRYRSVGDREPEESWIAYRAAYLDEMRASYRRERAAWRTLLSWRLVVLQCFCALDTCDRRCHRVILAEDVLLRLGAGYGGEVEEASRHRWDHPAVHVRICTRCKLVRKNIPRGAGWVVEWVTADGKTSRGGKTPPCTPRAP